MNGQGDSFLGANTVWRTFLTISIVLLDIGIGNAQSQPGWGLHPAETKVQGAIVVLAKDSAGKLSGQSEIQQPRAQGCDARDWCTDTADGDGARMRSAIKRYYIWCFASRKTETLQSVTAKMKTIDLANSFYSDTTKTELVNKIVAVVNFKVAVGPFLSPSTDNDTLLFLAIQRQCLEWAIRTAIAGGGTARGYGATAVTNPRQWRPGMGLYRNDKSHAMLIVDIYWDSKGNPLQFRVAEANYGPGWTNPPGMPPWSRTVSASRVISVNTDLYRVVSYE